MGETRLQAGTKTRKKLCWVTTSPLIVNSALIPHLLRLCEDYEVTLVVNASEGTALKPLPGLEIVSIPILREIYPRDDACALWQLIRLFRKRKFDLVHSYGPKSGLLTSLAAWIAQIPIRLHTFTGQVWVTRHGPMRRILKAADRIIAELATAVLTDSNSQKDFLVKNGIVREEACTVLGSGSVSGVNTTRFKANPLAREAIRKELVVPSDAVMILFLGRLNADKGIPELLRAFGHLFNKHPNVFLALVGPDEGDCLKEVSNMGAASAQIRHRGYTPIPEDFVAASDMLCLPSHREGFPLAIIEAAAAGVPTVASRIYGISDAIVDGHTGLLHALADPIDLAVQLERLVADPDLRCKLGENARLRVMAEFTEARLTGELARFYQRLQ